MTADRLYVLVHLAFTVTITAAATWPDALVWAARAALAAVLVALWATWPWADAVLKRYQR